MLNWLLGLDFKYPFKKLGRISQKIIGEKVRKKEQNHLPGVCCQLQIITWVSTNVDIFTFLWLFWFYNEFEKSV